MKQITCDMKYFMILYILSRVYNEDIFYSKNDCNIKDSKIYHTLIEIKELVDVVNPVKSEFYNGLIEYYKNTNPQIRLCHKNILMGV